MRRFTKISALAIWMSIVLLVVPLSTSIATAAEESSKKSTSGTLQLEESYPHIDGTETHMPVQNVGIKLYFTENVSDKDLRKVNKTCFTLTDSKNKKVPVEVYFSDKSSDANYILVTAKPKSGSLEPKSVYKLTISKKLKSSEGNLLGSNTVIPFQTVDTAGNTKVYMLLMVIMIVCMIGFTIINKWRKEKAAVASGAKEKAVNPYDLAKEKNISVREAVALIEKDK
ncbi:MAG: hypothetical protein LBU41_02485, partial [Clostridiales Family XIII bacterium]|nr:hypothetical protein [Clostridiales Family XIII bacterium]